MYVPDYARRGSVRACACISMHDIVCMCIKTCQIFIITYNTQINQTPPTTIMCKHPGKTNHAAYYYGLHHAIFSDSSTYSSDEVTASPLRSPRCRGRHRGTAQGRGRGGRLRNRGRGGHGRGGRGQGGHSHNAHSQSPWSCTTAAVNVEPFTQNVGSAVVLSACILGIFKLFFTPALIDLIVEQTNLYARQTMSNEQ